MKRPNQHVWIFFFIYFFFWMASNTLEPYLGLFYEARGLSGTQIGFATTIFSLAAVLSSLIGGFLEDRIGRPSLVILLLAIGMIAATGVLFVSRNAAVIMCAVFCYGFFYSPVNGITDKALLDELPSRQDRFARMRMGGTVGAGVGGIIAAFFVQDSSYLSVFFFFWLGMLLCGICAWHMPKNDRSQSERVHWSDYRQLVGSPYFLPIYLTLAVWGFTESGVMQFLALYITQADYPAEMTSVMIAVAMIGEMLGFGISSSLSRRLCHRHVLAAAFLLQTLRMTSLALLQFLPIYAVTFFQFLGGGAYALLYTTITTAIGTVYPNKISYSAHSLKLIANRGIGVSTGMLLLGTMFDRNLPVAGYSILSIAACASMVYYFLPVRSQRLL